MARPNAMRRMPPPRAAASAMARMLTSDLDLHDLLDRDRTDCDREDRNTQHDVSQRVGDHRIEVRGGDQGKETGEGDRQDGDDPSRRASLSGEGSDLALDAHPFADGEGDGVEDFRKVAADHAL